MRFSWVGVWRVTGLLPKLGNVKGGGVTERGDREGCTVQRGKCGCP